MTTTKSVQLQGGFAPLTPDQGQSPQTPIIGSRSALAIWPPPISTPGSAPVDETSMDLIYNKLTVSCGNPLTITPKNNNSTRLGV